MRSIMLHHCPEDKIEIGVPYYNSQGIDRFIQNVGKSCKNTSVALYGIVLQYV